ncbi:hypothetical protein [Pelagicoccus mobilis]|uniref:SMP-30/Gluconolactonase/LRE-like region domain-containing protein n=1 Tax=Pelagicoccus mobilis TaxID=415221 RepID=A0A934VLY2_9BACT|nr:hypothetical protein [Pelagicoccus mobilis]MBK1878256.1 hypothetical protein [Pelagicoccus mobilis]
MRRNVTALSFRSLVLGSLALMGTISLSAREYEVEIVKDGLNSPTGIASHWRNTLVFTEVPEPGTPAAGNAVKYLNVRSGKMGTISEGEPNPVNVAISKRGEIYWTCKTAGVILRYDRRNGKQFFLPADPESGDFLLSPNGIDVDSRGDVLFTEVPLPGTPGANMVSVSDGMNITTISDNEPAPTDIVIGHDGTAYWTCQSAGVILKRSRAGVISLLLSGLEEPAGIALDASGKRLYFTELPTPGVPGDAGGSNRVMEYDLREKELHVVADGFPLPADVTVSADGTVYWTCTAAGVIAKGTPQKEGKRRYRY